jgi:stage II sporulation protein D
MKLFLAALGLALILEAIPYFVFPEKMKEFFRRIPEIPVKILRILGLVFIVLGLVLIYVATAYGGNAPSIRISIKETGAPVEIEGTDLLIRELPSFEKVALDKSDPVYRIALVPGGMTINQRTWPATHLVLASGDGVIRIDGKRFQGRVEVVKTKRNRLLLINDMDLERYLVGLINHEISSAWPPEAVKAQAVAARTYAYFQKEKKMKELYDLESSVLDQVYGGIGLEDERAASAVRATAGEVLTYQGRIIKAVFHSCCGGRTENSEAVWGEMLPYLRSVPDPYCTESPRYYWRYEISIADMSRRLGLGAITKITLRNRTASGRVRELEFGFDSGQKRNYSGEELRKLLGYDNLKSTNFRVESTVDEIKFSGSGSGHGVGMCQWGAKGMADKGFNYRQILSHFYQGTRIERKY